MLLDAPRDGLPPVLSTPPQFSSAARSLAAGHGPIAVDTERAQSFRFDDRIFLLQLRRAGSGTTLIAPEQHRAAASRALAGTLNSATWIIHSAPNDLPMLRAMGFYPPRLIDTEIASRFLGLDKPNLSASLEHFLGISLAKGHGRENWSRWPLPTSWLTYAALDVELLIELSDTQRSKLASEGKIEWMEQECAHILRCHDHDPEEPSWTSVKGARALKSRKQRAFVREIWRVRRQVAQRHDLPEHRILPHPLVLRLAQQQPSSAADIKRTIAEDQHVRELPSRIRQELIQQISCACGRARSLAPERWPGRVYSRGCPAIYSIKTTDPVYKSTLRAMRRDLGRVAASLGIDAGLLIDASTLKRLIAHCVNNDGLEPRELDEDLTRFGVRPWQRELVRPVCEANLVVSSHF